MRKEIKEKPPLWFPIAPIMVIVFIILVLLLAREIVGWLGLGYYINLPIIVRLLLGIPLIFIGITFFIWGFSALKPAAAIGYAKRLRTDGAFKFTRNPMYFGVNAMFWGTGFLLDKTYVIIGAFLWSILNYLTVILWEEKQMFRKFGDEYLVYKKKVYRFLPLNRKRKELHL